jgi:hypothetical protein
MEASVGKFVREDESQVIILRPVKEQFPRDTHGWFLGGHEPGDGLDTCAILTQVLV